MSMSVVNIENVSFEVWIDNNGSLINPTINKFSLGPVESIFEENTMWACFKSLENAEKCAKNFSFSGYEGKTYIYVRLNDCDNDIAYKGLIRKY